MALSLIPWEVYAERKINGKKNITINLERCIYHYKYAFDKIAHLYHRLLERGPIENMIRLVRHLNIPNKNVKETMEKLGYIKL